MYLFYHKRGKAEMEQDSNAQAPNKDSAFLPAPEGGGLLPRFGDPTTEPRLRCGFRKKLTCIPLCVWTGFI